MEPLGPRFGFGLDFLVTIAVVLMALVSCLVSWMVVVWIGAVSFMVVPGVTLVVQVGSVFCGAGTVVLVPGGEVWTGDPVSTGADPETVVPMERAGEDALCAGLVGLVVVGCWSDDTVVMVGCSTAPPPAEALEGRGVVGSGSVVVGGLVVGAVVAGGALVVPALVVAVVRGGAGEELEGEGGAEVPRAEVAAGLDSSEDLVMVVETVVE